jgi:hypothetical protein
MAGALEGDVFLGPKAEVHYVLPCWIYFSIYIRDEQIFALRFVILQYHPFPEYSDSENRPHLGSLMD